jgi:serine/threonine protein kinase
MGVIIYELVTGYTPFCSESLTDTINRIIDIDYQFGQEWMKINKLARDLVSRLLKKKGCRLTAEEALKSPWMFGKKAGVSELLVCSGTFAFGYDD